MLRSLPFSLSLLIATPLVAQTPELASQVEAIAARHLQKPGAVGLSIGIARKGEVLLSQGYGLADAEFEVPANAETMFRIGSVTKQITAALILRQVEAGKLKLDDTLSTLLPEFTTGDRTITLTQLLDHTSGIKSYTDIGKAWEEKQPLELTDEQLLDLVRDLPADFAPGQGWHYNNTGYYLLGMIVAKTASKPYAEAVAELAAELGLQRTRYDSNGELIKNRAQGYAFTKAGLRNDDPLGMSQPGAAGALLSTGGDLVRWSMALSGGKVVRPETFARMTTSTKLPSGRDTHYGFGLIMDRFGDHPRVQHGGGIHGFNSFLVWLPDADLHVAVISNGERLSSLRVAEEILWRALGETPPVAQDQPTTADLRQRTAGKFRLQDLDLNATIGERDAAVTLQIEGQDAVRLLWQGERTFVADFDHAVRIVFGADFGSFELHQSGGIFYAARQ
ncbi:MAG: beta-lactamase family protein [Planctomycetes bacterium]|nr:beta-lactamase family protein [Planctomycetota bacterium]